MEKIEKYINGEMSLNSLIKFEKEMKKDFKLREKVILCRKVDSFMQASLLAAEAEIEMLSKEINLVASMLVKEFYGKHENNSGFKDYFRLS